jgi:predicted oxidoreductase
MMGTGSKQEPSPSPIDRRSVTEFKRESSVRKRSLGWDGNQLQRYKADLHDPSATSRPTTGDAAIRFSKENSSRKTLSIADRLRVAEEKHCTPAQLALAWLLRRGQDVIPIPGTSSIARLEENIRAADVFLNEQDLNRIENALPKGSAAGERYAPAMMKVVNG